MRATPHLIQNNSQGEPLSPIHPANPYYREEWLQELLRCHPDILPVAEIEPVFYPLVPIGREVTTTAGSIDNLFISPQGYPVLVETKLWRNPEAKREILSQVIDYAASISQWNFDKVDEVTRKYTARFEGSSLGLLDWIPQYQKKAEELDPYFLKERVDKNFRLGRYLMLVVGDHIHGRMIEMLEYINRFPHLAINIALVELQCYKMSEDNEWPLIVVPTIVARTQEVSRSIVQVTVEQNGSYSLKVEQQKEERPDKRKRAFLTEEAFWELLKEHSQENFYKAQKLVERHRDQEGITIDPTEASLVVRLYVQDSGEQISLFFIDKKGNLNVWTVSISDQFKRFGLNKSLIDPYLMKVKQLLHSNKFKIHSCPISKVDLDGFMSAVDEFIEIVQTAELKD